MLSAFSLALAQLADPRILRVLLRSLLVTLLLFAAISAASWWGLDALFTRFNLLDEADLRGLASLVIVLVGGWLLWRILALMVLQMFADEVVLAVEQKHYSTALAGAQALGWRQELANGLRGAARALGYNLLALPVALVLLITGIGPALVFWAVNAVLIGRELTELVWQRHRHDDAEAMPLGGMERFVLGGAVAALLAVPFINLLAPVLGAAAATHAVHRKRIIQT